MPTNKSVFLFGVKLSIISYKNLISILSSHDNSTGYVCFPSSDTIAIANKDQHLKKILNESTFSLIDGKITEKYLKFKGISEAETFSGYKLLDLLLKTDCTHLFYGSDNENLELLKKKLSTNYPNARILGFIAPPYLKELKDIKDHPVIVAQIKYIKTLNPDLIWIGISSPKQDYLMHYHYKKLNKGIMIGVGAVFLYMSGKLKKSPEWIKRIGLRWLFRMLKEPFRLIPFVLPNLLRFIWLVLNEMIFIHFKDRKHL